MKFHQVSTLGEWLTGKEGWLLITNFFTDVGLSGAQVTCMASHVQSDVRQYSGLPTFVVA